MKKLIALLICALMILSMAAFAETAEDTALIARISNIALEYSAEGQAQNVNLDGFEAYLTLDTADGIRLVGQAFNGDDELALAVLKIVEGQIQVAIDGMDKTYVADVPQLQGIDLEGSIPEIRAALPQLLNVKLPMIPAISLPKLDVVPLLALFGTQEADGSVSFNVPAETIDALLDQLLEAAKANMASVPAQAQETVQQLLGAVEQLRSSGIGFAVDGTGKDAGDSQTVTVNVHLASQGQVSPDPIVVLTFTTAQDKAVVTLDAISEGNAMTVATADVATEEGALVSTLDIAGMLQLSLNVFQEGTVQYVSLSLDGAAMEGASMAIEVSYGETDEGTLEKLVINGGEAFNLEATCLTASASDVSNEGQFSLYLDAEGTSLKMTADLEQFLGSLDLGDFTMPETTAPFEELDSEEGEAALTAAVAPLLEYLDSIIPVDQAA